MPAAAVLPQPHRVLRRARLTAVVLLILSTLTGVVPLTAPSAAGAQENEGAAPVDLTQLELEIAYAPHPPTPNETILLISRVNGPEAMLQAVDGWWYDWTVDGDPTSPDPSPVEQARHVTRRQFTTAGDRNVSLTICPTPNAANAGCLQTNRTITVVDGTTANERPIPLFGISLGESIFVLHGGGVGTYYRLEDQHRSPLEATFSRPGAVSARFVPEFVGNYTLTVAKCHADPNLRCRYTERTLTVHPEECDDPEAAELVGPTDATIGRLDNNVGHGTS